MLRYQRVVLIVSLLCISIGPAVADDAVGFQLNRYEPTPAGEMSIMVNRPRYSPTFAFGAGLTSDYGYALLQSRPAGTDDAPTFIISHLVTARADLAMHFLGRGLVSLSLPLTLWRGSDDSLLGSTATQSTLVGDLRIGGQVLLHRWLFARPNSETAHDDVNSLGLHLAASFWMPFNDLSTSVNSLYTDHCCRVMGRLILDGRRYLGRDLPGSSARKALHVSGFVGASYRAVSVLDLAGPLAGVGRAGPEVHLGLAMYVELLSRRLAVGGEGVFSSMVAGFNEFGATSLAFEALTGVHYRHRWNQHALVLSAAAGGSPLGTPGVAAVRGFLRLSYEFEKPASNKRRPIDKPPQTKTGLIKKPEPKTNGLQSQNADSSGGTSGGAMKISCPGDADCDGVPDIDDACEATPPGSKLDRKGCPVPEPDADGDAVADKDDSCPNLPAGLWPDPQKKGCPELDTDFDQFPDRLEADECIRKPGVPAPPPREGCPSANGVYVKNATIVFPKALMCRLNDQQQYVVPPEIVPLLLDLIQLMKDLPIKVIKLQSYAYGPRGRKANWSTSASHAQCIQDWLETESKAVHIGKIRTEANGQLPSSVFPNTDHVEVEILLPPVPTARP